LAEKQALEAMEMEALGFGSEVCDDEVVLTVIDDKDNFKDHKDDKNKEFPVVLIQNPFQPVETTSELPIIKGKSDYFVEETNSQQTGNAR